MVTKSKRNYGIDLLRLFAMFLIVMLHVLTQGQIIRDDQSVSYYVLFFLEVITYCAVDIYALISGFVGYTEEEKPYRYHKYLPMWLQVFLYNFSFTLLAFFKQFADGKELFFSAFPVLTKTYWYFTMYTALFFLIPFINKAIRTFSKREMNIVAFITFVLFSVLSFVSHPFQTAGGFSFLWLFCLYILGAWMKKCDVVNKLKTHVLWIMLLVCNLATWTGFLFTPEWTNLSYLFGYCSPTMVGSAFCFVCLFSRMNVNKFFAWISSFFAPCAFGVYLIHNQVFFANTIISGKFTWVTDLPLYLSILTTLGISLAIFLSCLLIDKVRILVFQFIRIDEGSEKLCKFLSKKLHLSE